MGETMKPMTMDRFYSLAYTDPLFAAVARNRKTHELSERDLFAFLTEALMRQRDEYREALIAHIQQCTSVPFSMVGPFDAAMEERTKLTEG